MHVLLGVGGTDPSIQALEETAERVREAGDDLTVAVYTTEETQSLSALREEIADRLEEHGIDATLRLVEDDPGSALVTMAEAQGIDRIALAGGVRSPLGKIQLDPVSEFVLLNATTTVTLVR